MRIPFRSINKPLLEARIIFSAVLSTAPKIGTIISASKFPFIYSDLILTFSSQVGTMIIEVAYGFEALLKNDPFIDIGENAVNTFSQVIPGAFLVDMLPILKFVPSWMPGASFKRKAEAWKQYADQTREEPFRVLKTDMVGFIWA